MKRSESDLPLWRISDNGISLTRSGNFDRIIFPCLLQNPDNKMVICVDAVWDTGAVTSAIHKDLAEELKLIPVDHVRYSSAIGMTEEDICEANIKFTRKRCDSIRIATHRIPGIQMIIGMDIISTGRMTIRKNKDGQSVFSFVFQD